jgi:RHS repeat-associated protein
LRAFLCLSHLHNRDYAQVIAETDSANVVAVEYIFGDDLLAQNRSGTLSNYQYDGLGSTRALTDSTGNVSDEYFYDAFGVELARTGTTENDYLFTGEQYDAGLGNYYLRARYYDQNSGRFTQQDTYMGVNSDPVTLHKYMYANAAPTVFVDPTGHFADLGGFMATQRIQTALVLTAIAVPNALLQTLQLERSLQTVVKKDLTALDVAWGKYQVKRCQRTQNARCKANIPVIVHGGDIWDLTNHIFDAQMSGASPVLSRKQPGWGRDWYRNKSECLGRGRIQQCDEYPFNSTEQGGPSNNVSLRLINGIHNQAGGTMLNMFYSGCGVDASSQTDKWFGVIAVPSGPSTSWDCGIKR